MIGSISGQWGVVLCLLVMLGVLLTPVAVTAFRRGAASALTVMCLIAVALPFLCGIALGFREAVLRHLRLGRSSIFEEAADATIDVLYAGVVTVFGSTS